MGLNRYFVPDLPKQGRVELPSDEAHHAVRVRREVIGGPCVAFDGVGHEANCQFVEIGKQKAVIEVVSYRFAPIVSDAFITLGIAMPKGDRQRNVIEKAVELGVHRMVPLVCQRSTIRATTGILPKWSRYVVEACKQCERNQLMTIDPPTDFFAWIDRSSMQCDKEADPQTLLKWLAHPDSSHRNLFEIIQASIENKTRYDRIEIGIGPEGGFAETEVQQAQKSGWQLIDFGPRILRVETAVSVAGVLANLFAHTREASQD